MGRIGTGGYSNAAPRVSFRYAGRVRSLHVGHRCNKAAAGMCSLRSARGTRSQSVLTRIGCEFINTGLHHLDDGAKKAVMNTKNNSATARVERPHRSQVEMQLFALDQLLSPDHRVRVVWAFVKSLDLEPLYEEIRVTDNLAGRSAIAPEILVALWLEATLDGIGSARELDRRCQTDIVYLWILGGVTVNYHTLSDFRVRHGAFLERLLTDSVAALIDRGLVPLETIAQDGMRVRASAGKSSFRRRPTLEELQQQAQRHLDRLMAEAESETARQEGDARRQAAALRRPRAGRTYRGGAAAA